MRVCESVVSVAENDPLSVITLGSHDSNCDFFFFQKKSKRKISNGLGEQVNLNPVPNVIIHVIQ